MSPPPAVLLLTSARLANPDAVSRASRGDGPPAVASSAGGLTPADVPASAFSTVVLTGCGPSGATPALLRLAVAALAPGGKLELEEEEGKQVRRDGGKERKGTASGDWGRGVARARSDLLSHALSLPLSQPAGALAKALLLAGFVDVVRAGPALLTAAKPAWAAGAAAPLAKKAAPPAAVAAAATGAAAWKLAADGDGEDDLIDDDALLSEADRAKPAAGESEGEEAREE